MLVAVASGKGGTGKTTVAVNLAVSAALEGHQVQLLDCDVEEPNCHIFLSPQICRSEPCQVLVPKVHEDGCSKCGLCAKVCSYHAIFAGPQKTLVFPELCHSCGACSYLCPKKCIEEVPRSVGVLEEGKAVIRGKELEFVHGVLNPGEVAASTVVKRVRKKASSDRFVIIDSPPGTSCTMVQSVRGADLCILVTEPTPFGLHDLKLAYETVSQMGVPVAVVVNRCDIGDDRVDRFCESHQIPLVMRIPMDKGLAKLYAEGRILVTSSKFYEDMFGALNSRILDLLSPVRKSSSCHNDTEEGLNGDEAASRDRHAKR